MGGEGGGPRPPGRERPWSVLRHAFDGQNAHRALEAAGLQKVLAKDGLVLGGSGARQQLLLAVRKLAVVAVRAVAALRAERRTQASPCKMSFAKFERAGAHAPARADLGLVRYSCASTRGDGQGTPRLWM